MAGEKRYTLSSIMTLLIDNHAELQQLYHDAAQTAQRGLMAQLLEFNNRISRQMEHLRRARMQGVVEISLEPISGLNLDEQLNRLTKIENCEISPIEKLIRFERELAELCRKCSPHIEKMSTGASQLINELSQESDERAKKLSKN